MTSAPLPSPAPETHQPAESESRILQEPKTPAPQGRQRPTRASAPSSPAPIRAAPRRAFSDPPRRQRHPLPTAGAAGHAASCGPDRRPTASAPTGTGWRADTRTGRRAGGTGAARGRRRGGRRWALRVPGGSAAAPRLVKMVRRRARRGPSGRGSRSTVAVMCAGLGAGVSLAGAGRVASGRASVPEFRGLLLHAGSDISGLWCGNGAIARACADRAGVRLFPKEVDVKVRG